MDTEVGVSRQGSMLPDAFRRFCLEQDRLETFTGVVGQSFFWRASGTEAPQE